MPDIKIRIPLVINSNGAWNTMGWGPNIHESELLDLAFEGLMEEEPKPGYVEAVHWITFTVPVPELAVFEITEVEVVPDEED
jgi:hypothetical protein